MSRWLALALLVCGCSGAAADDSAADSVVDAAVERGGDADVGVATPADTGPAHNVPACQDSCPVGARSCKDGHPWSCEDADDDGCVQWVALAVCDASERCVSGGCQTVVCGEGAVLSNGKCVPIQCGPGLVLKYGGCVPMPCGKGTWFKDGKCAPACKGSCEVGATRCLDGAPEICTAKQDGPCGGWVASKPCKADAMCFQGVCELKLRAMAQALPWHGGVGLLAMTKDADDKTLYVGGEWAGVSVSVDGGKSWGLRSSGLWKDGQFAVSALAAHPGKSGHVYALVGRYPTSSCGLFESKNHGATWAKLDTAVCSHGHGTYRNDGGALAVDPQAKQVLVATPGCGLVRHVDAAAKVGSSTVAGTTGTWFTAVLVEGKGQAWAAAMKHPTTGASGGLWMRAKGGEAAWNKLFDGDFTSLAAAGDGTLYIGGHDGLWRLSQGKANPQKLLTNTVCPKPQKAWTGKAPAPRITSLLAYDSTLIVGTRRHSAWGACRSALQLDALFRSTDGGKTFLKHKTAVLPKTGNGWVSSSHTPEKGGFYAESLLRIGQNALAFAGHGGVWRSDDDGKQLTRHQSGLPGGQASLVSAFRTQANERRVVAGVLARDLALWEDEKTAPVLLKLQLDNEGDRKLVNTVRALLPIPPHAPKYFVAALDAAYWHQHKQGGGVIATSATLDGKWQVRFKPGPYINTLVADPTQPERLGMVVSTGKDDKGKSAGGIWLSIDGGKSWERRSGGLLKSVDDNNFLRTHDPATLEMRGQTMYASMFRSGVYRTTNAGKNWQPITLWTKANGQLAKYPVASTERVDIAAHPKDPKRVWVMTNRYSGTFIAYSKDGGLNFEVIDPPYSGARLHRMAIDRTGSVLLLTAIPYSTLQYPGGGPGSWSFELATGQWHPSRIDGPEGQSQTSLVTDWTADRSFLAGADFAPVLQTIVP